MGWAGRTPTDRDACACDPQATPRHVGKKRAHRPGGPGLTGRGPGWRRARRATSKLDDGGGGRWLRCVWRLLLLCFVTKSNHEPTSGGRRSAAGLQLLQVCQVATRQPPNPAQAHPGKAPAVSIVQDSAAAALRCAVRVLSSRGLDMDTDMHDHARALARVPPRPYGCPRRGAASRWHGSRQDCRSSGAQAVALALAHWHVPVGLSPGHVTRASHGIGNAARSE